MKEFLINTDDLIKNKIEEEFDVDFDYLIIEGVNEFHFSMLVHGEKGFFWLDIKNQSKDDFFDEVFESRYEALKFAIMKEEKVYGFEDQRQFINWFSEQVLCYGDEK